MSLTLSGESIDARGFWRALAARPIAAVAVTAAPPKGKVGFLGLSFAHVSAQPPTVLVSISRTTNSLVDIIAAGHFAANILPAGAGDLAKAFGGSAEVGDRFAGHDWGTLATGAPVLRTAPLIFDCRIASTLEVEAAVIVIGRVAAIRMEDGAGVTLAFGGGYTDFGP